MQEACTRPRRELSREEISRQCEELELIVDAIPAFVFYKDVTNKVLRRNRAAADLASAGGVNWSPDAPEQYQADLEVIASGQPKVSRTSISSTSRPASLTRLS